MPKRSSPSDAMVANVAIDNNRGQPWSTVSVTDVMPARVCRSVSRLGQKKTVRVGAQSRNRTRTLDDRKKVLTTPPWVRRRRRF